MVPKNTLNTVIQKKEEPFKKENTCAYPWQQMVIDLTGEVQPCCFWGGYGNSGKPLGNTNEQSIEEIWNGTEYQKIRQINNSGNISESHPCHNCLSYIWSNNQYPPFEWPLDYKNEEGFCYTAQIPENFLEQIQEINNVLLFEDDKELPYPEAPHDDIRKTGCGRFSVWGRLLYMSTSDNSSPIINGRKYELRCGQRRYTFPRLTTDSLSGKNLQLAYQEYQKGKIVLEAKPTMISFVSTSDCNIECPSCSQNLARLLGIQHRPKTEPDVLRHIPYLHQLIWHGGEPLLIRHLRDFIHAYKVEDNPHLTFGFTTNGTLLNRDMLEDLIKFPRINASISMDSFNSKTYADIRTGANFNKVLENTLRAIKTYNAPERIFVVGMIILKRNILELPSNLEFALKHDIGLNLSPVVIYPVHERLDIFQDFKAQTEGWPEAIDQALEIVRQGKEKNARAFGRVDSTGMLEELKNIYERAAKRYADTFEIKVIITDPTGSLPKMRRPGIIFARANHYDNPMSYALLDRGPGEYTLHLPRQEFTGNYQLDWSLCHDMCDSGAFIDSHCLMDNADVAALHISNWIECPSEVHIEILHFESIPRKTNAKLANNGMPKENGCTLKNNAAIWDKHLELFERERSAGYGLQGKGTRSEVMKKRHMEISSTRYSAYKSLKD